MSMSPSRATRRRRRTALPVLLSGAAASLVLAAGLTPTLAGFTASITNGTDTAGSGALTMQESDATGAILCNSTDGGSVSTNSATCTTINAYGGDLAMTPGQTKTTTISIKNTGTVSANSFTLAPGTCTQQNNGTANGTATDLCTQMTVAITSGSSTLYSGALSAMPSSIDILAKTAQTSVAPSATTSISVAVKLPAGTGNTYAGLKVSQPLTWTFGS